MAKLTLDPVSNVVTSPALVATLESNFDKIETAIENTISRDGTSPNQMLSPLDMNSNRIINLSSPQGDNDAVRLIDLRAFDPGESTFGYLNKFGDTMLGSLELAGNATTSLQAIPKQQLDSSINSALSNIYNRIDLSATISADAWLTPATTTGGYYSGYDCKAGTKYTLKQNENTLLTGEAGVYRDGYFIQHLDYDQTNYVSYSRRVISDALRVYMTGAFDTGIYKPMYKDLTGITLATVGNIADYTRGCSGISSDVVQYGSGTANHEFTVQNPGSGAGGQAQSRGMVALQAIVRSEYADVDVTHPVYGLQVTNVGKLISAGISFNYSTDYGHSGYFKRGIDMSASLVTEAAIVMAQSAVSPHGGTTIDYGASSKSYYDRTANKFVWVTNGSETMAIESVGALGLAGTSASAAWLAIPSSTGLKAHIRLTPGGVPTSPQNGDIWFDGNLRIYINGVKTITVH